jgi:hypothetical protein
LNQDPNLASTNSSPPLEVTAPAAAGQLRSDDSAPSTAAVVATVNSAMLLDSLREAREIFVELQAFNAANSEQESKLENFWINKIVPVLKKKQALVNSLLDEKMLPSPEPGTEWKKAQETNLTVFLEDVAGVPLAASWISKILKDEER